MDCNICARSFDRSRKPLCITCAQVSVYEPRIRQVTGLLERENYHTHSEAIVRPGNDGVLAALSQDADWDAITNAVKKHSSERAHAEQERVEARIAAITEQADSLRKHMEDYRSYIRDVKRKNEERRQEITTEQKELASRRPQVLTPVESAQQKAAHRAERVHTKTVDARAYICRHSSSLNGIHQLRDIHGKHTGRYQLNGLVLPNLKELNSPVDDASAFPNGKGSDGTNFEHHAHVNACLDNICHLLGVWCHYLSIRLPAEIILPHSDFPHSAILPEKSSYKATNLPYPTPLASHPSSPSASRLLQEQRNLPRPRLLHLDRPLSRLAKEDPKTFGLFVEGTMLLAWDVAWLCRSQGIATINTFDEICDIGRNIWLLSLAQQKEGSRRDRERDRKSRSSTDEPLHPAAAFGMFSHGNLGHSLAGHEGAALLADWRLSQPHRPIDKLRNHLLIDITGAEWDVLDEEDYADSQNAGVDGGEIAASTVLVGGAQRRALGNQHPAMSVMSVTSHVERPRGESGWMKVRDRGVGGGT